MKVQILNIIFLLILISCQPCKNVLCKNEKPSFSLNILDNSSSEDLIFGESAQFELSNLKMFSITQDDTVFHNITAGFDGTDSLLLITLNPISNLIYLKFSPNELDTIEVSYQKIMQSECCPSYSKINAFSYNKKNYNIELNEFKVFK